MKHVPMWRRYERMLGADPAADVDDELRFHLEAKVDDLMAQGWDSKDARKEAERQFGDLEIGVRMALGATQARVRLAVIAKTLRLAMTGIAMGAIASFVLARGIAALLYKTEPTDPATFTATILLLAAVALVSGYIPARRASNIDPMKALRGN